MLSNGRVKVNSASCLRSSFALGTCSWTSEEIFSASHSSVMDIL